MRFMETTLFTSSQKAQKIDYYPPANALTVRCAGWDWVKGRYVPLKVKIIPATQYSDLDSGREEFINFMYRGKGSLDDDPMRHIRNAHKQRNRGSESNEMAEAQAAAVHIEEAQLARIEGWAQQIPPTTSSKPLRDMAEELVKSRANNPAVEKVHEIGE
jgi:hypothetical protein